jgi:Mg-chelatase subunit ChlD
MELSKLTEYDTILLVDRSGSMSGAARGFADRWTAAKELTINIATLAAKVDDDGITVSFFGGTFNPARDVIDGVKDASTVADLFAKNSPGGSTPTAEALQAAFDKKFASGKKAIVICVTDGEPNDQQAVAKTIIAASNKLNDAGEIRVLFLQVGDDAGAARYLDSLDNSLSGAKFDIVNAITFKDADGLSAEALFERAIEDSHVPT